MAKMNKALAWSMHSLKGAPKEYRSFVATHPNLDAGRILSPEYGQAIKTLEGAAAGEIDYRHPDVAKAFDMLNPEIALGATGGRKVSTSRLYPGKTPGTVMVGLRVDGDPEERPLTERRSADPDDPVKEVKLEDLFGRLSAAKQYRGLLSDPENQKWFVQQTIGEELKKRADQETIKNLQVKKLKKEINKGDPVTYQADGEGNLMQLPSRSGGAVATPVLDSKGNPVKAPQKTGAGTQATQRVKDYDFGISKGMSHEQALEWASSDKTLNERAEAYAKTIIFNEKRDQMPENYDPAKRFKDLKADFIKEYGKGEKSAPPSPEQQKQPFKNGAGPLKAPQQGGVLYVDANGNKAWVYPDGSIEEVQ
ncbi:MAG TPA: hypothetical protein PKE57_00450 [Cellvibrionaceae bacterium]|nr:hypothetical protein [Cellvibrionaceae bacterium]